MEAEKSVIGSLLVDKESIIKISDFLLPEDCYHDAHRIIYQAIIDLYDKRTGIDNDEKLSLGFDVLDSSRRVFLLPEIWSGPAV